MRSKEEVVNMGFKICSESDELFPPSSGCVTSPADEGEDAQQSRQEGNGGGEYAKWIIIALCVYGIFSGGAPVGVVFLALILLTYTGSEHKGGNDARKK
jgi:hypothetical protein